MNTLTIIGIIAVAIIAQVIILRAALQVGVRVKYAKAQTEFLVLIARNAGVDEEVIGETIRKIFYTESQRFEYRVAKEKEAAELAKKEASKA